MGDNAFMDKRMTSAGMAWKIVFDAKGLMELPCLPKLICGI